MKIDFESLNIDEIVKMLSSYEECRSVYINIFIRDWIVNNLINTFVSVELLHLVLIHTSRVKIKLVHNVQNCCDSSTLKSLNIHIMKWI